APDQVPQEVKRAAVFSVPVDLKSSAEKISLIYTRRFLKSLGKKLAQKQEMYPNEIDLSNYSLYWSFPEFDDKYTAPLHGFDNAADYYRKVSSRQYLPYIKTPTLVVNAKNDPFLGP